MRETFMKTLTELLWIYGNLPIIVKIGVILLGIVYLAVGVCFAARYVDNSASYFLITFAYPVVFVIGLVWMCVDFIKRLVFGRNE